ncbi:substrate-binding domain-containing protein [Neoaquamicrobium sediminum]|uniref:substrate-binding domain-containing protein n=1 Tax=Neoaquamicrobium sediminum TaxID=1849104 RepID=UPI0019D51405|nr:substrate-binding domain-containing protein [Mesorhizobium sediminum]
MPDDYVLVLTRTMLIPRDASEPDLARAFVDFALSPQGQAISAGDAALGSIVPGSTGPFTSEAISARGRGRSSRWRLGHRCWFRSTSSGAAVSWRHGARSSHPAERSSDKSTPAGI